MKFSHGINIIEFTVVMIIISAFVVMVISFTRIKPETERDQALALIQQEAYKFQSISDQVFQLTLVHGDELGRKAISWKNERVLIADGYPIAVLFNFLARNAGLNGLWQTPLRGYQVLKRPGNVPYHVVYGLQKYDSLHLVLASQCYIDVKTHISYPFRPNRLVDYRLSILSEVRGC